MPIATVINHRKDIPCIKVDTTGKPLAGVTFSLIHAVTHEVADRLGAVREQAAPRGVRVKLVQKTVGDRDAEAHEVACHETPFVGRRAETAGATQKTPPSGRAPGPGRWGLPTTRERGGVSPRASAMPCGNARGRRPRGDVTPGAARSSSGCPTWARRRPSSQPPHHS